MKQTIEEAAKQELMSSYAIVVEGELVYQRQAILNMFKKGVEWLSKQSPWISVEERLPEYSCWVLVAGKDYKYRILFYCGGKFYTNKSLIAYDGSVLFWMFIPSFDQILEANKDVLQRLK
jgi:hypothetical protein